jgi:tetratricopeptide (TPR) repeat protein
MRSCGRNKIRRQDAKTPRNSLVRFSWGLGALAVFLGCCSAWRPDAAESYTRGKEALRTGEYPAAADHFEAALRSRAGHEPSQSGLLETLRLTGRYAEAVKRADGFLAGNSGSAALHLERGRSAAEIGDYAAAEQHLRTAQAAAGPLRGDATVQLALLLENTGRARDAHALWQRLVDEYKKGTVKGSQALGNVAVAAWQLGYAQDAKDIFLDATSGGDASLEAFSDFGYLFLDKYNATDAIGVFRDCLKINKNYPPALLGMALAKKYESNAEVEEYARKALEVNPNSVGALLVLAGLRMEEESYDAAQEEIRRALAVNARNLEALSSQAVWQHFRGDAAGFARVERQILDIDPAYGKLYYAVAENLVTRRKYREAVEFNRKAIAADPKLWAAHASLGINLMRLGEIPEGRRSIQRAFEGDPFNVWAFNTLDLLDQMDKFVDVRSEHFVIRMAKEDHATLSHYVPMLAEEVFARLTKKYGFTPPELPITVEIFPDHAGFAVRTLGLPGLGALGVCFGRVIALDSPRARKAGQFNWGTTLWHEFAHVITLEMTRHNVPRWLSEGVSVYEERRARPGWGDDITAAFVRAYKDGKLLKVSELNAGMMRPKFPEQISLSYYQASLVCELIEEKFGFDKLREVLRLYADNLATDEVFRRALGLDRARLDDEYKRFVEARLREVAPRLDFKRMAEGGHPDRKALAALAEKNPNDFFAHLQLGLLAHKEKDDSAAEPALQRAAKLFPEFVDGGGPYAALVEIYEGSKRDDDALTACNAWSAYDENALDPILKAGEIYRKRKDWPAAARTLERAVYIHPYDSELFTKLAEAASETGNWPVAVAASQARLGLAPSDLAGAHFDLARALLGAGKRTEARREILKSLEIAPTFEKAQALLLKLSSGQQ